MSEEKHPQQNLQKLEQEIEKANPALFKGLDTSKRKQVVQAFITMTRFSGPIPDPETLRAYNEIIPNGAERIFVEFEKQGNHRRALERKAVGGQVNQSYIGQAMAFIIALAFMGAAIYLTKEGFEFAGAVIGVADLAGLVTVFIKGKYYQKENLASKNK